jgi:hypothetical protein
MDLPPGLVDAARAKMPAANKKLCELNIEL